jgi:aspartate racemase
MKRFEERGVALIYPPPSFQALVMAAIREIKTSRYDEKVRDMLQSAATELVSRKAEALVVACTELSIIADAIDQNVTV